MPKLTKRAVDAAAPRARDWILWDESLPGFGLRVQPSGLRSYVVQYRHRRRTRRVTLGRHGVLTPAQARDQAQAVLAAVREGRDPAQERRDAREALTVQELGDRYLREHADRKKKPRTAREDRRMLEREVYPALGARAVLDVSRADVHRLHQRMHARPVMANRVLALLGTLFTFAERLELRSPGTNPTRYVERYRERKRDRFLSGAELTRLGTALAEADADARAARDPRRESSVDPMAAAAIRLLLFTGCRRSEILRLRWDEVDAEQGCLRLKDAKTGPRTVPLNAPALELLERLREGRLAGSRWVLPGRKRGEPLTNIDKSWRHLRDRAKLEDLRLHDLRHSYASAAAGLGLGLPLIGALLGHRHASTTQRYAHLADDPVRRAAELTGSRLRAELEGRAPAPVIPLHPSTQEVSP